jgi:hypothetical protein
VQFFASETVPISNRTPVHAGGPLIYLKGFMHGRTFVERYGSQHHILGAVADLDDPPDRRSRLYAVWVGPPQSGYLIRFDTNCTGACQDFPDTSGAAM